jgi:hypothetical protein
MTEDLERIIKDTLFDKIEPFFITFADEIAAKGMEKVALAASSLNALAWEPIEALKETGQDELLAFSLHVDAAFDAIIEAHKAPEDPQKLGGVTVESVSHEGVEKVSKARVMIPGEIKDRDLQNQFRLAINEAFKQAEIEQESPFFGKVADRRID